MIYKNTKTYLLQGILLGYFFTSYMTISIPWENKILFLSSFLLFSIISRLRNIENKKDFLKIISLGIIVGYSLNVLFLYNGQVDYQYPVEQDQEHIPKKNAAILVLPTYPQRYEKKTWQHIISNSTEYSKVQKKIFSPFILYRYKKIYKKIGSDPSTEIAWEFEKKIKKMCENNEGSLYVAYLNQKPFLEEQIARALQEGANNIGIVNVLLEQSDEWFHIQERIEKIRFYNYSAHIFYSSPFWESKGLKRGIAKKIEDATKEKKKSSIGILFIGNGYENKININLKEGGKQQIAFARDIKNRLIITGHDDKKIKIAFLNNSQYSIKKTISEILDQGVSELIIVPLYIPFDNIYNKFIIPEEVQKVEIPSSIKVNYISAWNTHPDFIEEVYSKLEAIYEGELSSTQ